MSRIVVLVVLLSCCILSGCESRRRTAESDPWRVVFDPPGHVIKAAEDQDRSLSLKPWRFADVDPQVFRNERGYWRVAWIKKDPLRDSYWYRWYELTPGGKVILASKSSVPSDLEVPDPRATSGW